ncbi:restriction endonuclease [Nocardia rhizosphaerihabitans]|uniref:restriction endonuclease n=1 Tax=Nocardia rhizosphaerihabitans TaxID=1691570 RepID=UPI003671A6ED
MEFIRTPRQAELNAAEVMKRLGYVDATATEVGADGGIDIRARGALAQVKWKGAAAGRPDLQRLVGARGHGTEQLYFFAATAYSRPAVDYANDMGIILYLYDLTGGASPVSRTAPSVAYQGHSWRSGDYLALLHGLQLFWKVLIPRPAKRSSRRHRARRYG